MLLELNYNIFYLKEISCVFDSLGDSFHHFFPWQMPSYLNSFILTVFGYNPSLHCPILATGEPWRFISVHHDAFSGNSCLATSQIFCSLPMDQSHQAPVLWAVLLIVPQYPSPFLLLKSVCQVLTHEPSTSVWFLSHVILV